MLAFAAVYVIWGSTYLGIKVAVESMPPYLMAGARFLLAGLIMAAWLAVTGRFGRNALSFRAFVSSAVVGVLMLGTANALVVWAIHRGAPTGLAAVIVATTPFWLVVLDRFVEGTSRITAQVVAGLGIGLIGIAVLTGVGGEAPKGIDGPALIALVGATLAWSVGSILSRSGPRPASPLVATAVQMVMGGAILFVGSLLLESHAGFRLDTITLRSWIGFVYLVVFGSLVGYTAFVFLLRHVSAAAVGTYAYVNPVVAVFLGTLLNDEPLTAQTLIASSLILVAVILLSRARTSPRPAVVEEPQPQGGPAAALRR